MVATAENTQVEKISVAKKEIQNEFRESSDNEIFYGYPGSKFRTEKEAKILLERLSDESEIAYTSLDSAQRYAAQYLESLGKASIYYGKNNRTYVKAPKGIFRILLKTLSV